MAQALSEHAIAIAACARTLLERASAPDVGKFLGDWPALRANRVVVPAALPVLKWLSAAADAAPAGPLAELSEQVRDASSTLAWRQSYRRGDVDARFLERYGWCEIFGLSGPIPSETLACGLLLLGPDTLYPSHNHAAEELYLTLSGAAEWQRGTAGFALRRPGETIVHASSEPHAMRTAAAPLLALYLWRGEGLGERARLRVDAGCAASRLQHQFTIRLS